MDELPDLKKYVESLPKSMTLKKKIIKVIMKSEKPLTQKEILETISSNDWTNLKRVLRDLLDEGYVVKKFIGTREYYVKVEFHRHGKQFVDGDVVYFVDVFEPDFEGEEKYIRIKQAQRVGIDEYEMLGKISIRGSVLPQFLESMNDAKYNLK